MPWIQAWVDPNTGASFPASYVRVTEVQPDPQSRRVNVTWQRWAGLDTYSLGLQPVQVQATQVSGSAFVLDFETPFRQAQAQFGTILRGAAGSFVTAAAELSGAAVAS